MNEQTPLIKPDTITLKSEVTGEEKNFKIGRYNALDGMDLVLLYVDAFGEMVRKSSVESIGSTSKIAREAAIRICAHCEVQSPDGKQWIRLSNDQLINAHIPDYEMLMLKLLPAIHDYNSAFFATTNLSKTSLGFVDQIKQQATKMFSQLLESSSPKSKRRSKN